MVESGPAPKLVMLNEVKHLGNEYDQRLLSCSGRESDKNADPIWPASKHSAYFDASVKSVFLHKSLFWNSLHGFCLDRPRVPV